MPCSFRAMVLLLLLAPKPPRIPECLHAPRQSPKQPLQVSGWLAGWLLHVKTII